MYIYIYKYLQLHLQTRNYTIYIQVKKIMQTTHHKFLVI